MDFNRFEQIINILELLSILLSSTLALEDNVHQPLTLYLQRARPTDDLKASGSFLLRYGGNVGGFLPKGELLGPSALRPYSVGSLSNYENYGYLRNGGNQLGGYGYGGYGGLKKGSGYTIGQSGGGLQNQASGYQLGTGQKGENVAQVSQNYAGGEDAQKKNEQDSGFSEEEAGVKKKYEKGGAYEGHSTYGENDKQQGAVKNNEDHKKGHSTKGVQNYHHKDESSQSTTFFDESNDEGDHYDFHGQQGMLDDQGGSSFKGGLQDGSLNVNSKGKSGQYNSGYAADKQQGTKTTQEKQQYLGDNENYNQNRGFEDYGKKAALNQQQRFGGYYGQQIGEFKNGGNQFGRLEGGPSGRFRKRGNFYF